MNNGAALSRFREEYGAHRASEGRAYTADEMKSLPFLDSGPLAKQWSVRARTFESFVARIVTPAARAIDRPVRVLDLGAGNGWLSWRVAKEGGEAVALDIRDDSVDGLGAASFYLDSGAKFERVVASFDAIPIRSGEFDIVVFNASLHYALDLVKVLREARRMVCDGGRVVILDSPFYERDADGIEMVAEKRRSARERFGQRATALMALPFIEYLTTERLESASSGLGLDWRRHPVRYPLWYETRPVVARIRGRRQPSRFDLWEGVA